MVQRALARATIGFGLMVASCSDDADSASAVNASQQALYALGALQYVADGTSSYVALVPNLTADTAIDYDHVFQLPSTGRIWSSSVLPHVFLAVDDANATVTKYALDANAALTTQGALSFAAYGISAFSADSPPRIDIVSTHKAYLFDAPSAQAIAFDPDAMTASQALDLGELTKQDWTLVFGESSTLLHDGKLLVFGSYLNSKAERFSNELRVVLIDPNDDAVSYLKDERCSASVAAQASSGDIYFASGTLAAAYQRVQPDSNPAPCLRRLASGSDELDLDVELSSLTDGSATGGLIPAGDDAAYVLALDEALMPITDATLGSDVYGAPAWRWWRVELGQTTLSTPAMFPISTTGRSLFRSVDDQIYADDTTANDSSTALVRTSTDGDPEPGISARGVLLNVVRMR